MVSPTARIALTAFVAITVHACPINAQPVLSEAVAKVTFDSSASATIELLLSFDNDLDPAAVRIDCRENKLNRAAAYRLVMDRLEGNRRELEHALRPELETMKAAGKIESYTFYTVAKTVRVRAQIGFIDELKRLPGIRAIDINHEVSLIDPVDVKDVPVYAKAALAGSALDAINVRSLWNRGLTGAGALIASFDTGIDGDHPALQAKWRGGSTGAVPGESWYAPHGTEIPTDNIGHGTHVMGIMVGSTDTDTIGVAPGAQWISAAVIDQGVSFSTTIADFLSAYDWILNPDGDINTTDDVPDVICNSWGIPKGIFADCDNTFFTAIDNVEAAGIVTVFAAGNEGPTPKSLRLPASRATSPLNTLSVGAVDHLTRIIADFSSRGPATCDGVSIKPELVAPGIDIYSSYKDGGYRLMSGTSMATPFVAGLVALMRQYNPEATVDEIKSALLAAATDLGPTGEDNSYGFGLIDASRLLNYLPAPEFPIVSVFSHQISSGGDSFADPGETAEVTLTLNEPTGSADSIDVWLSSNSVWVTPLADTVRFRFGQGATYAVSLESFRLQISNDAISGRTVDLTAHYRFAWGNGEDSSSFALLIGHELPGRIFSVQAGDISLSASEFGQFGFGSGSIYQAGGDGFRFRMGDNLLFEAGLIVARSQQIVSDGIRNESGTFEESDFIPETASTSIAAVSFDDALTDHYNDDNAPLPIPIRVRQSLYASPDNFAIVQFEVFNPTPERLDHLSFGMFCDFDLDRSHDLMGFDSLIGMLYQYSPQSGLYVGLVGAAAGEVAYLAAANGPQKRGFTTAEKSDLVSQTGITIEPYDEADWYCVVSRTVSQVEGFGSRTVAVILAAGESLSDLRAAAMAGVAEYDMLLDADDQSAVLPDQIELAQNFPNPFNPQTTIRFTLGSAQRVTLIVSNVLGQTVRTLYDGRALAGVHTVAWNGRDESGATVASGVYFYRLAAEQETVTRKMMLLK